jgi:hypothetical protein
MFASVPRCIHHVTVLADFSTRADLPDRRYERRGSLGSSIRATGRARIVARPSRSLALVVFLVVVGACASAPVGTLPTTGTLSSTATGATLDESAPATLGTGTFTGGTDVMAGLYDVTPGVGQSGVVSVDGSDALGMDDQLEVLGGAKGVPTVRMQISRGDVISIRSLSQVTFAPVTHRPMTDGTTTLHAGNWTVGADIAPGRYVVTTEAGHQGQFVVSDGRADGNFKVNTILGGSGGVASLTVDLRNGDLIKISGLSRVTVTPA